MGLAGVLFFGVGMVYALVKKHRDRIPLIIDDQGIRNGQGSMNLAWSEIHGVYTRVQHVRAGVKQRWVAIDSPEPGRLGRLARTNASMIGVPENAARHLIQWDGGIRPDLDTVVAKISSYGVPVYRDE